MAGIVPLFDRECSNDHCEFYSSINDRYSYYFNFFSFQFPSHSQYNFDFHLIVYFVFIYYNLLLILSFIINYY